MYPQMIEANRKRREYFDFFSAQNVNYASDNLSKPYIGKLSPGCSTCINGTWSCLYLNRLCTRNCFYCTQDRTEKGERLPTPHDVRLGFVNVQEYIEYLQTFPFEGVGISGGEPFLAFDRLVEYTRGIRSAFGTKHYLWVYTNGDLVTEARLALLRELGLDEIRFDISANGYDLRPVKLAGNYIETVTVEIPAIPEDLETVKGLLEELQTIGAKHLNIHELMRTEHNREQFNKRGYSLTRGPYGTLNIPVLESELAALEILKHALSVNLQVGVNYCSTWYKGRFQGRAVQRRYASFGRKESETVTRTGLLRKLSIGEALEDAFSPQHLKGVMAIEPYHPITVTYALSLPQVKALTDENKADASAILSFGSNSVIVARSPFGELTLSNRISALLFDSLFVANHDIEQVVDEMVALFPADDMERAAIREDIRQFYLRFENLEYLPRELPDYEAMELTEDRL